MMDHDDNRPDAHGGRRYHTIARANANAPVRGRVRAPVLISGLMILMLGVTVLCIPADKLRGLPLAGGATGTLVAAAIAAVVLGMALMAAAFIWPDTSMTHIARTDERDELIRLRSNAVVARVALLFNAALAAALTILAGPLHIGALYAAAAGVMASIVIFAVASICANRYFERRL